MSNPILDNLIKNHKAPHLDDFTSRPETQDGILDKKSRTRKRLRTLDVWMNGKRVGRLEARVMRSPTGDPNDDRTQFVFSYARGARPHDAISSTMPVRSAPYISIDAPHPVFSQYRPEMELFRFPVWRHADYLLDEMGFLAASGNRTLAHFRFSAPDQAPNSAAPLQFDISALDEPGTEGCDLFLQMVSKCSHLPGVAGVQPKVLVQSEDFLPHDPNVRTLRTDTHILKVAHQERFEGITVAEHCALSAARKANIDTNHSRLSHDGSLLCIERFDFLSKDYAGQGVGDFSQKMAMEDFGHIFGIRSNKPKAKYNAPLESIAENLMTLNRHLKSEQNNAVTLENLSRLFDMTVFNYMIKNGDAHLKNFGVLYSTDANAPRYLAPMYDVVTTAPLIFGIENSNLTDSPALTLNGKQEWDAWDDVTRFGTVFCGLTKTQALERIESIANAVSVYAQCSLREYMDRFPKYAQLLDCTRNIWNFSVYKAVNFCGAEKVKLDSPNSSLPKKQNDQLLNALNQLEALDDSLDEYQRKPYRSISLG